MQQFEGGDSVRPLHGLGAISRTARVQQSVFRPQYKQDRWVLTNLEEGARVHQASFFQTVDLKKQGQTAQPLVIRPHALRHPREF